MTFTNPRLRRLFADDERCIDIAIDHGAVNERALVEPIRDARAVIAAVAAGRPDAIQVTAGLAPLLAPYQTRSGPQLVLRTDVSNVYGTSVPRHPYSELLDTAIDDALRLDAVCVVANLLLLPDQPELHRQCVANIARLVHGAHRYGIPVMAEPLVMSPDGTRGGYQVDGDIDLILPLVRQAAELGVDLIKADPTDDLGLYSDVVEAAAGIPVLVRGGGKAGTHDILRRTQELMATGVHGIVYGRNVFEHPDPAAMIAALRAIVHDGESADHAHRHLENAA